MKILKRPAIALLLVILLTQLIWTPSFLTAEERQEDTLPTLFQQLAQLTNGKARISNHARFKNVRFLGTEVSNPVPLGADLEENTVPEEAARVFLAAYGFVFGLADQANELKLMHSKTGDDGRSFVRFQQVNRGVPVIGGELIVQVSSDREGIISANAEIVPDITLDTTPRISTTSAQETAVNAIAKKYGLDADDLTVSEPELWIYNPTVFGLNRDVTRLVWRMEVKSPELFYISELVLVDAHLGAVALHFNQVPMARNRLIYDNQNNPAFGLPGNGPVRSEGQGPTGISDVNYAYDYMGDTYDFYDSYHGRDSLDDAGMTLIATVRYCEFGEPCPYANAGWDGTQMVFGDGWASADDIVAHELTHGVTNYESNLFYYMQSGAINEAFSDIWGEFVDLTNGAGNDAPSVRWLIGEDMPGGARRSMSNPPAYDSGLGLMPDRMTSLYYYCGEEDNGGVHHNMGIGMKAAYLMVDGGSFNGYTVAGIGLEKTADMFYEVQTNLLTSASDYADLYNALQQAAVNLGYTAGERQSIRDALDATEMNMQPVSCPAMEAPVCESGIPVHLFFDDMENPGSGNWASAAIVGLDFWVYPQEDITYATSGVYSLWGLGVPGTGSAGADYYIAMTSDVALPPGSQPCLHFHHAYAFDEYYSDRYDGGVLEYSTNGGGLWNDAGSLFTHNGYDGAISTGYGNPLEGRQAFVGESNGYISSRLDLSPLEGQSVRFRFRIGVDKWSGLETLTYGWFIDDVRIYTCSVNEVSFSSATYDVDEGNGTATITVNLSPESTQTVTVDYASADGTAEAPGDYTSAGGTVTFNPGQTSRTFDVTIIDDDLDEQDETVDLTLSNPSNAVLGTPDTAVLTITDNDTAAVSFSSATYDVDEGNGTATITVNLSPESTQTVTVDYASADGTAEAPDDYTAAGGTLNFNPGQMTRTFDVTIIDDLLDEGDETVNLTLSSPTNALLGTPATAVLTITDNDTPEPGYQDIPLAVGWNLMGVPLVPADSGIGAMLTDIIDGVEIVWGYDNSGPGSPWKSWSPVWGGDLAEMVDCMGYWIKMNSAATLRVYGYPGVPPAGQRDIPLNQNWNLMSMPLMPSDPAIDVVLASIVDNVEIVWGYDNSGPGSPWKSWSPVWGGDLAEMVDCMGYWIKMKTAVILVVEGSSGVVFD